MSRPAELTPVARHEAAKAVRRLVKQNPAAARNLRLAIVEAARLLGGRPLAGRRHSDLVGTSYRIWSLTRFSYVLVYDPNTTPPQILRIAHTSRDLGPLLKDLVETPKDDPPPT